jgi:GNAT superfamily N-acetyltransferase
MADVPPGYRLSTDKADLSLDWIIPALKATYWAEGRTEQAIRLSIENSRCYGIFLEGSSTQVAFARVVTDEATFSWLCDVVVDQAHQRKGLGKVLVSAVTSDPALKRTTFQLRTRDAHGLYEKYGFVRQEVMLMKREGRDL